MVIRASARKVTRAFTDPLEYSAVRAVRCDVDQRTTFPAESLEPVRNPSRPYSHTRVSIPVLAACFFGFLTVASGQPLSFGVIGGAGLTQDFQNQRVGNTIAYSTPKRWIAGGMVEVRLPLHLSVEVDGLYHELEFTNAFIEPNGTPNSVSPAPVVTWEFPLLAKYRFSLPLVKPFVEAGPSFRTAGNLNSTSPSSHGFTAGMGVEAHVLKLRIAPQVRYTRWARDRRSPYSFAPSTVPDQAEFLVAFSY
jgi:hypothetical protein